MFLNTFTINELIRKMYRKESCSSDCCFFPKRKISSLVLCLLEDFGKLLNEPLPSLLKSFNTSTLSVSDGDAAKAVFLLEKLQLII